eukprot:g7219.t1
MTSSGTNLPDWGYEELKVIGRGQYGKAHLVRAEIDDQYYIAKTIDLTCLSSKDGLSSVRHVVEQETAYQEVALLRRLDHPNIVSYRDNFFMGDTLVIIMQYFHGFQDMRKQRQRIDEQQIMHYFVQILQALQYIHGERILHRDLKTSNLFLMKSKFVVKLGDFGISRVLEGSIEAAITVVGTPYYMSPEVCENKPYTFKSDVWSLGCCLYEMCMLKHAFSADNLLGLVYKIVSDKYEPIPELYTAQLDTLIQRMLEKNAEIRPSVRELLADPPKCGSVISRSALPFSARWLPGVARPRRVPGLAGRVAADAELLTGTAGAGEAERVVHGRTERVGRSARASDRRGTATCAGRSQARAARCATQRVTVKHGWSDFGLQVELLKRPKRQQHGGSGRQQTVRRSATRQRPKSRCTTRRWPDKCGKPNFRPPSPAAWAQQRLRVICLQWVESERPTSPQAHRTMKIAQRSEGTAPVAEDSDYSEEYEDDFEDAQYTEDEDQTVGSDIEEVYMKPGAGQLRVFSLCVEPMVTLYSSQASRGTLAIPIMELRSRMKEELIRKMGEEPFEKAFNFLLDARMRGIPESAVKRDLEALVGRAVYKQHCFDLDQLVYQARSSG